VDLQLRRQEEAARHDRGIITAETFNDINGRAVLSEQALRDAQRHHNVAEEKRLTSAWLRGQTATLQDQRREMVSGIEQRQREITAQNDNHQNDNEAGARRYSPAMPAPVMMPRMMG
jgi:hypothetical protein